MENACLTDQQKSAIAERLSVAEHCLLEGADEYLQASSILNNHIMSNSKCKSGDGGGHLHDEDSGHGLNMERYEGEEQRFLGTAGLQDKVETNSSNVNIFGRTHKM